jgi:sugar phosphate isomerase/epimerase
VSWCFHSFAGGSSPEEALDIIGRLGFQGTDLILLARDDIQGYWTDAKIAQIKQQLERNRLELAQFVIFQPVIEGLTSPDAEERRRNLDYFEAGCRIGQQLMNLHIRDIDGLMREFVDVGTGVMDFQAVAEALKAIEFQGFLSIEQDKTASDMQETCARYLNIMRGCTA